MDCFWAFEFLDVVWKKADQCKSAESERNRCVLVQEGLYQPWQQSFVGHFALRWPKHFARFPQTIRLGYIFTFFKPIFFQTDFLPSVGTLGEKLFPFLSSCYWVVRRVRVKKSARKLNFLSNYCLFNFTLLLSFSVATQGRESVH